MAELTAEQIIFLCEQNIPLSKVFDASGLRKSEYKEIMKLLDMEIAYGVSPCKRSGHTLRTRYGHCVQCGTHNIAFMKRYGDSGIVYLAKSHTANLYKIGSTTDLSERSAKLNYYGYGGCDDWEIVFNVECLNSGRVEFEAQNMLHTYRVTRFYWKDNAARECKELFECEFESAVSSILCALHSVNDQEY